jgi:ABC-type bacteriocin/lantibiotic exporter with double-glycine peptidase domain
MNKEMKYYREFVKLFKPHWHLLAISTVVIIVLSALKFPIPLGMMYFIDTLKMGGEVKYLKEIIIGILLVAFVSYFLKIWLYYLLNVFKERVFLKIQLKLFYHIHELPMAFFNKIDTGYLMSRMRNDVYAAGGVLADKLIMAVINILTFIIALVLCLWVDVTLTLIALSTLPFFTLALILPSKKLKEMGNEIQEKNAFVMKNLEESLKNVYLTKLFGRARWRAAKLMRSLRDEIVTKIRYIIYASSVGNLSEVISDIGVVLILGIGIMRVTNGSVSLGKVIAFMNFYGYLFSTLSQLVGLNIEFQRSLASIKRIYSILGLTVEGKKAIKIVNPAPEKTKDEKAREGIEFSNVYFSYDRNEMNLIGVSFKMKKGEILALTGKSGSGKSTIVHLLAGFYKPKKGRIRIDGNRTTDIPLHDLRRKIGVLPHDPIMFSGTIKENITLGDNTFSMDDVVRAAKMAMAHDFISRIPGGYDCETGEGGVALSIGERQRIAIARTILRKPEILVIDEGTSGLDSSTEQKVLQTLSCMYDDGYLILITHRFFSMRMAGKIAVLEKGRIVDFGTPEEVSSNTVYRDLYQKQVIQSANADDGLPLMNSKESEEVDINKRFNTLTN